MLVWKGSRSPGSQELVMYECPSTKKRIKVSGRCVWGEEPAVPENAAKVIKLWEVT